MSDSYRRCYLLPKITVELESGGIADLTIGDCMRVLNQLMHHRFIQFEIPLPKKLMGRDIGEWEHIHASPASDACWQYEDDHENMTITVVLDEDTAIGGLPREEFRNVPKGKEGE